MSIDGVESDLRRLNIRKAELMTKRREQTAALKVLDDQLASKTPATNDAQIAEMRQATGLLLSALRTGEREMESLNETERRLHAEHEFWQKNRAN
jgi:hypothetical protein